jgi:hypothetical protein
MVVGLVLALASAASQAQPSFTLVRVQTEVPSPNEHDGPIIQQVFGDTLATVGDASLNARARVSLGNAGAYAFSADDREAFGETWWVDGFTVSGGVGQGVLSLSVSVTGTLTGEGRANYGLFARQDMFSRTELAAWLDCPSASPCIPAAPSGSQALIPVTASFGNGTTVLTATLPFTYGQTVYVASYFGVETWAAGEADFYGSAHFGISAPQGTVLESASSTTYLSAAAVPEPSRSALLLAGVAVLLAWKRRRVAQTCHHAGSSARTSGRR